MKRQEIYKRKYNTCKTYRERWTDYERAGIDTLSEDLKRECFFVGSEKSCFGDWKDEKFIWPENSSISYITLSGGPREGSSSYEREVVIQTMPAHKDMPSVLFDLLNQKGFKPAK